MSAEILELLVGKKILEYGLNWRIYDSNDNEIFAPPNMRGLGKLGTLEFWQPRRKAKGKNKPRWIERDGKILIFNTPEEAEEYIESEKQNSSGQSYESEQVNVVNPVEVIDKVEITQLSKAYNYQRKLYQADQIGDIDSIIAIYKELQEREEDDIEMILIGAL